MCQFFGFDESAKNDSEMCKFFGFDENEFESLSNCFQLSEEKKRLVRENLQGLKFIQFYFLFRCNVRFHKKNKRFLQKTACKRGEQ